jgi:hypothetical protein
MSDDRQEPPAGNADDRTAPQEPVADDRTARQEPVAGEPPSPPDRTAPLPPAERPGPAPWSGRAEVPPPRPADYREPAGTEWYAEEQRGRRWWMPILLGILALLLLGLIGAAVWLGLRSANGPTPEESPTPGPTSAPATTSAPTSAAPTTQPPSTPPTSAVAQVPMPPLVGLPRAAAQAILDRLGIDYRIESRPSDRAPGTVIGTDPGVGVPVPRGQQVTVVVAEAAAPTTSAAVPTTSVTATP